MKKLQIAVLGSSKSICTKKMYVYAEKTGEELAKKDCVVITGGGLGVMEAAMKGAKKYGGTTLAIVPWEDKQRVNDFADLVVATGIGWSRNSINLNSCDAAIVVGGGAGTLNEVTYAYMANKPTVCITTSGGIAKEIAGTYFDIRKTEKVYGVKDAKEAVDKVLELVKQRKKRKKGQTDLLMQEEDWNMPVKEKAKKKPSERK